MKPAGKSPAVSDTEAKLVEKTTELSRFSRYLQLLHRLTTTNYWNLDELLASYLATGCEIFGTQRGAVTAWNGSELVARKSHTGEYADANARVVFAERRTLILEDPVFYVGTPILDEGAPYGTIGFWNTQHTPATDHPHAKEIVELLAKSIGVAIHQRQLTDQLAFQATHDALTGLPNRVLMEQRLNEALLRARSPGMALSVAFIDLDRFKQINDTLGHSIGDLVLGTVASRLASCIRPGDTLARMGGDEFTAILAGADRAGNVRTLRQMLAAVRIPCRVLEHELFVTASIGVAHHPEHGEDAATLLKNADGAMYSAKYGGKDDVQSFSGNTSVEARQRLGLENDLRRAVQRRELRLLFQPEVTLDRKLAAFEVLLLWEHPEHGRIPPSQFIPIAEETGMILQIGLWVLHEACAQTRRWINGGYSPVPLAVNVSALQVAQPDFVASIAAALGEAGVPPHLLQLELTESLVMKDVPRTAVLMQQVRDLGVEIAIDDFGTGYSSLSYLRKLPADILKIDGSFLDETESRTGSLALMRTITALGHTFGLEVVAEGVETEEQFQLVIEADCDRAQGHLFGSGVPASRAVAWMSPARS